MKRTLIIVLITLLVAGYVYWYEVRPETRTRSTDEEERVTKTLAGVMKRDIRGFVLAPAGGPEKRIQKVDEDWLLTEPVGASTEESTVKQILYDIEWVEKQQTIPAAEVTDDRLEAYGLDEPRGRIDVLTRDEGTLSFYVGGENPGADLVYVREGENGPVHLVDRKLAAHLDRSVFDLRRKTVIALAPGEVGYVQLFGPTKAALAKEGDYWNMEQPFQDYADPATIRTLLENAAAVRVVSFVEDDAESLAEYGLEEPEEYVTIAEAKTVGDTFTVNVGKAAPPAGNGEQLVYAALEGENTVFTLRAAQVRSLFPDFASLRSDRLARIDPYSVEKLILSYGLDQVELVKEDGSWRLRKPFEAEAAAEAARELLETFADAELAAYLTPEPEDLAEYGLDVPSGSFTFLERGREEAGIVFGSDAGDETVYAKRTETPGIFKAPKRYLERLATPALELRSKVIQRVDMTAVDAIVIERGGDRFRIARAGSRRGLPSWEMVEPVEAPANEEMMMALAPMLATLRAVDLVERAPEDLVEYGLDAPGARVEFETAEDVEPLLVGTHAPGGTRYAMLDGGDLVFTVRQELQEALDREVRENEILSFDPEAAEEVEFRKAGRVYSLSRSGGEWKVDSPEGASVESAAVADELRHLSQLETPRFISYRTENLGDYGLENPTAVVRVLTGDGVAALSLGDEARSGLRYGTSTTLDGVFLLVTGDVRNVLEPEHLVTIEERGGAESEVENSNRLAPDEQAGGAPGGRTARTSSEEDAAAGARRSDGGDGPSQ